MHARAAGTTKKGRNLVYGTRYARATSAPGGARGAPGPSPTYRPRGTRGAMSLASRIPPVWRTERPFLVALALGALVRVLVQVAFPPAFVYSDGPTYLALVDRLAPSPDRPVGYGVLLRALSWLTRGVDAVAVTQHLLGLLTAVVLYALLRRWRLPSWLATLATVPLLLDEMQLVLEHSVLSDVVFDLLLVLAVAALAWSRSAADGRAPRSPGLLLGAATLVRVVGEPTVLAAVLFCLLAAVTWRARLLHVPSSCWSRSRPRWRRTPPGTTSRRASSAITQASGRALYMRTTAFVDCRRFSMPAYERALCPAEPLGRRQEPTRLRLARRGRVDRARPAAGVTLDEALLRLRASGRSAPSRSTTPGSSPATSCSASRRPGSTTTSTDTAYKWSFSHYVDYVPTELDRARLRGARGRAPAHAAPLGRRPRRVRPRGLPARTAAPRAGARRPRRPGPTARARRTRDPAAGAAPARPGRWAWCWCPT